MGDADEKREHHQFDLNDFTLGKEWEAVFLKHVKHEVLYNKTEVSSRNMSMAKKVARLDRNLKRHRSPTTLPDRILEEILSRLPVKFLVRYMCVSKHWKSLILTPRFKSLHHKITIKNPPSLLWLTPNGTNPDLLVLITFNLTGEFVDQWDLPVTGRRAKMFPLQSEFNELVCLTDVTRVFVCNPSIKRCIKLPDSPMENPGSGGFAYLPSREEYVIVQIYPCGSCHMITLSISDEDKLIHSNWKLVKADFCFHRHMVFGCFVYGCFYWLMGMGGDENLILSFDVEKETFSTLDLPLSENKYKYTDYFTILELKGDLYVNHRQPPTVSTMELWKINDDRTWSKMYTFSNIDWLSLGPICMNGDGEILFFSGGDLKYYNAENGTFREEAGKGKFDARYTRGYLRPHTDNMFLIGN